MDQRMRDAFREGMASYGKNRGKLINPYPMDDERHNEFERGWTQAIKRVSPTSIRDTEQHRVREEAAASVAEEKRFRDGVRAYRNRKG